MSRRIGLFHHFGRRADLALAVTIGSIVESLLAVLVARWAVALTSAPPWLEASQMPGVFIVEHLEQRFRWFSSWTMAFVSISVFQGLLYIMVILGVIYTYRLLRSQPVE